MTSASIAANFTTRKRVTCCCRTVESVAARVLGSFIWYLIASQSHHCVSQVVHYCKLTTCRCCCGRSCKKKSTHCNATTHADDNDSNNPTFKNSKPLREKTFTCSNARCVRCHHRAPQHHTTHKCVAAAVVARSFS